MTTDDRLTSYAHWNHLPISFLVHATAEFVVFLDHSHDVDWKTSNTYDTEKRFPEGWARVQTRAAALEQILSENASAAVKRSCGRLIAEGLARGLGGDVKAANDALDKAEAYVTERNREVGRLLRLKGASATWAAIFLFCSAIWLCRKYSQDILGSAVFSLILCTGAGATGALLSVFLNAVSKVPDSSAAKTLQYFEAVARIGAGSFGAVVAALGVQAGFLFPQLRTTPDGAAGLALVSIVAGFSERLVPDLVRKVGAPEKAPRASTRK
jgi:hypothetical protein